MFTPVLLGAFLAPALPLLARGFSRGVGGVVAGVPVSTISKLLGRTSLTTTTTTYLNTLRRELHRAVQTREAAAGNRQTIGKASPRLPRKIQSTKPVLSR